MPESRGPARTESTRRGQGTKGNAAWDFYGTIRLVSQAVGNRQFPRVSFSLTWRAFFYMSKTLYIPRHNRIRTFGIDRTLPFPGKARLDSGYSAGGKVTPFGFVHIIRHRAVLCPLLPVTPAVPLCSLKSRICAEAPPSNPFQKDRHREKSIHSVGNKPAPRKEIPGFGKEVTGVA